MAASTAHTILSENLPLHLTYTFSSDGITNMEKHTLPSNSIVLSSYQEITIYVHSDMAKSRVLVCGSLLTSYLNQSEWFNLSVTLTVPQL